MIKKDAISLDEVPLIGYSFSRLDQGVEHDYWASSWTFLISFPTSNHQGDAFSFYKWRSRQGRDTPKDRVEREVSYL